MTPYLSKRRDGLCPSLLVASAIDPKQSNPAGASKNYQTRSNLLLQVDGASPGKDRRAVEFQTMIDCIKTALEGIVAPTEDLVSIVFNPQGCEWTMELNQSLNDADEHYYMSVICFANDSGQNITNYVVDTRLTPKEKLDTNEAPLQGFKEAKAVHEYVALKVRKAIVSLEFPEFPEGCKGRAFRDVYQLNARVRGTCCL